MLLERFAAPAWHDVEKEWQQGRIGSRECLARQVDLIRATPAELHAAVAGIAIDPGFPGFLETCERCAVGVTVVSDGFDLVIEQILNREGLHLATRANHLEHAGRGRWRVTFPLARDDCAVLAGNCKCEATRSFGDVVKIVIGDGLSDFCLAGRADMVFAKDRLLEQCRETGTVHCPFSDFFQVGERLTSWLREPRITNRAAGSRIRSRRQLTGRMVGGGSGSNWP
jgi:2-hydroxy-3-keto-5-methylthiopentenyl-1-phosphate phosphatase